MKTAASFFIILVLLLIDFRQAFSNEIQSLPVYKNISGLDFSAKNIRKLNEKNNGKLVLEGNVKLKYSNNLVFKADKIIISCLNNKFIKSIELLSNVSMEKNGKTIVISKKAFSDSFISYIDFNDVMFLIKDGQKIVTKKKIRYYFITGEIGFY